MIIDLIQGDGAIDNAEVTKPTVSGLSFAYNGSAQGPTITWDEGMSRYCNVTNATATEVGTYILTISLKNTEYYEWSDGTTADLSYEYEITKAPVTKPTISGSAFTYNGSAQGPTVSWDTGMVDYCTVIGATATAVGSYTLTVSLNDTAHYEWSDGTNADITFSYSIAKFKVTKPSISGTSFTYNGNAQGPTVSWASGMAQYCTVTGATATNAGSYTLTVSLNDTTSYEWADGTTANITQAYSIGKATGSVTVSPTSVSLSSSSNTATVTVTRVGDGTISISSSDTTKCTVSPATLSGSGSFTITGKGANGSATITVTLAAGTNYTGDSKTVSVTCQYITMKTFSAATEAELLEMVQAADNGDIDLYDDCGWRVGQERTVSLSAIAKSGTYDGQYWRVEEAQSAQTITLVLMHKGLYDLVTPVKAKGGASRSKCSFVVGVKNCLNTTGQMSLSDTEPDTWNEASRRNWCNGGFRGALPANIRSCFKKFQCITGKHSNVNQTVTTQDYFTFAADKEVFGSQSSGSTSGEINALTQFTWYETASNRIKSVSGSANYWWTRSPAKSSGIACVAVNSYGNSGMSNTTGKYTGISPFGVM